MSRVRLPALVLALLFLAAAPAPAQVDPGTLLAVGCFGLVVLLAGMLVFNSLFLWLSAWMTGLEGGFLRAMLAAVVSIALLIGFTFMTSKFTSTLGATGQAVLSFGIITAAETSAIKYAYKGGWPVSLLACLLALALSLAALIGLMILMF